MKDTVDKVGVVFVILTLLFVGLQDERIDERPTAQEQRIAAIDAPAQTLTFRP